MLPIIRNESNFYRHSSEIQSSDTISYLADWFLKKYGPSEDDRIKCFLYLQKNGVKMFTIRTFLKECDTSLKRCPNESDAKLIVYLRDHQPDIEIQRAVWYLDEYGTCLSRGIENCLSWESPPTALLNA